jgi:hypothetical protein
MCRSPGAQRDKRGAVCWCATASVSSIALGRFLLIERARAGMRDCHLLYLSVGLGLMYTCSARKHTLVHSLSRARAVGLERDDESQRARTRAAPGPRPAAATGHMRSQKPIVPSELFKFQLMHARVYCSRS